MQLSQRLLTLRKTSKAPLRAVASRCGCTFQHLNKLETGAASRPKMDLLYKLASFYQFPPDILIIEAGKIPQDVYWKIVRHPELLATIRAYQPA